VRIQISSDNSLSHLKGLVRGQNLVNFEWSLKISLEYVVSNLFKTNPMDYKWLPIQRYMYSLMWCSGINVSQFFTFQEPMSKYQPNLTGNILEGWGFRFVQIKALAPLTA